MKILAIETSCDETGAAVVIGDKKAETVSVISNVLATSLASHAETGGIIPEVAAREQVKYIIPVITQALEEAPITPDELDALAVTQGPGLIGSLLVGVETAKTLALVWNKPLIPVNHLYGHIYANWLIANSKEHIEEPYAIRHMPYASAFPALALVVSGGHTDLVLLKEHKQLKWLGGTRDDAAGECFDKCARLLGFAYPGGPKISELAKKGDPKSFPFPRPMSNSNDNDFSFSGLKTAFLHVTKKQFPLFRKEIPNSKAGWQQVEINKLSEKEKHLVYDMCASLEQAIIDVLVKKTIQAAKENGVKTILLSGGVAANQKLRETLEEESKNIGVTLSVPPPVYCTDNAAMIGAAAFFNNSNTLWKEINANPELYFD